MPFMYQHKDSWSQLGRYYNSGAMGVLLANHTQFIRYRYVLLELTIPPGSALYTLMQLTEFFYLRPTLLQSCVSSSRGVAVTATNLTNNSSDALCTAKGPAWFSACSKRDKESTMFCSPGKYLTLNL